MNAHVLIVDDNPTNLKLTCDVLECEDCSAEKAGDAREKFSMNDVLAAGCDAHILKPIDTRELPNKIEEVARQKSRRRRRS